MHPDCKAIRQQILTATRASGHGHIPTSFSVIEMIYAVYDTMRHDPKNPQWEDRDLFVLSKGHAALGFYCTLAHYGYFDPEETKTFGAFQSRLGCHPDRLKVPGAEVSTGSLGHGIGVAVGMALAARLKHSDRQVYTLIGDGESNEGSVWEAVMIASDLKLNNLTVLCDNNFSQVRSLQIPNIADRFAAFKFDTVSVNGHDVDALNAALQRQSDAPRAVVANTVKGYGCKTLVDNVFEWHRKSPNAEQHELLLAELETM